METFIQLSDIHFYAYHGCLPTENVIGTDYIVNLKIGLDLSKAMESDDLNDTINYQIIYDLIEKEIHHQKLQAIKNEYEYHSERIKKISEDIDFAKNVAREKIKMSEDGEIVFHFEQN